MSHDGTPTPCPEEMQTRLSRYVDGELPPDERAAVEEHVTSCVPCADLLSLFRKNESLMAGALATEAFGDAVIESVVRTLRKEDPPEARPVEETFGDWLRARPLLPLAAAALLVVGLIVVQNASHRSRIEELRDRLASQEKGTGEMKARVERAESASLEMSRLLAARTANYERLIRDIRTEHAIAMARGHIILDIEPGSGPRLRARFDPKDYDYYEIWRREDGKDEYVLLNGPEERLDKPEYLDRTARPGQVYWYKFRGHRRGTGGFDESAPVQERIPTPSEIRLEEAIQIWCQDVSAPRDMAKFLLERTVKGRKVSHVVYVNLNEPIGELAEVPGIGRVDFRTGLTLARIVEKQQTLAIKYAEKLYDETGKEVIERIVNGKVIVPASRQHSGALNLKTNDLVEMQPQGAPGQPTVPVWRDSWVVVPVLTK
jgi:hypothetical protein